MLSNKLSINMHDAYRWSSVFTKLYSFIYTVPFYDNLNRKQSNAPLLAKHAKDLFETKEMAYLK